MVADSEGPILAGLVILVVEAKDDAPKGTTLAGVLADHGAHVIAVTSSEEAMTILGIVIPDLLVSDIDLPGEHALGLIGRVRALARGGAIRALAVTAHIATEDRVAEREAGYHARLEKPVDEVRLLDAVEQIVGDRVNQA